MPSSPPHEVTSSWHEADNFTGSDTAHDDTTEEEEPSLYTVRFKCIGATRDRGHQSALEKANELMLTGKDVSVDLFFEPTNSVDRIDFKYSGPGFYAAVDITRKGRWSPVVCGAASPR